MKKFKKLVVLLENIHPYIIFTDIMRCFIMSCGFAFLVIYFELSGDNALTRELFFNVESTIFILLLVMSGSYFIFTKRWFGKPVTLDITNIEKDFTNKAIQRTENDIRILSIHEAGHALISLIKETDDFTVYMDNPRIIRYKSLSTAEDVKNSILICYAGAAAEELLLGNVNIGSMDGPHSDFVKATEYIKVYITMHDRNVSKALLDNELMDHIIEYSKEFYQMSLDILSEHRDMLELISNNLIIKGKLSRKQIEDLVNELQKRKVC